MGSEFLGNYVHGFARVVDWVIQTYIWIIIIRVLITWVNPDPFNPIVKFLNRVTDPVLHRVRSRLPLMFGGLDFSPILVILALYLIKFGVLMLLGNLAFALGPGAQPAAPL